MGALAERIERSLVLGAYGDWLGSSLEGVPLSDRTIDYGRCVITDDTVFTIATARAIAAVGGVDPAEIAEHLLQAFRAGVAGIGSSTLGAMKALAVGQHWALAGIQGDRAAGNGAAMRSAPLGFVLDPWDAHDRRSIVDAARITHRNDEAITGALALAAGVRLALTTSISSDPLAQIAELLPDTRVKDALLAASVLDEASPTEAAVQLGSSGYVVESVPLALWVGLSRVASAAETIEEIVMVADDADTVGSMVGQLLGAAGHRLPVDAVVPDIDDDLGELAAALAALAIG